MYKKRLKKWNLRKQKYRKLRNPSSSSPTIADDDSSPIERQFPAQESLDSPLSLVRVSRLEAFAGLEIVLSGVDSWSKGKLESVVTPTDPMSRYLATPNMPPIQDSRTMCRTFELVFDLWACGRGDLAGMAARKGFYALEYVLTEDHPDLAWHILDTVYDMVIRGHLQLLGMFLGHASVLAYRLLPLRHPLVLILTQLRRCDYQTPEGQQQMAYLLRKAWLRNVDILGDRVGSLASEHLWVYEQLIWDGRTRLRRDSELWRRGEPIRQALCKLLAAIPGTDADRLRVQALMLEFTQMDLGDKQTAEVLARQLIHDTQDATTTMTTTGVTARSNDRFNAYARKMQARIHVDRCDWDEAEHNLRLAVRRRETAHGASNDIRVVRDMWVLASYYRKVGRDKDADCVIADAIGRAQRYLDDVPG